MDKKSKKGIMKNALDKIKLVDAGVKNEYPDAPVMQGTDSKKEMHYPNLFLSSKEAPMLVGSEVEDEIILIVKTKVCSHSLNERANKKNEHFDLEIRKIGVVSTNKNKKD